MRGVSRPSSTPSNVAHVRGAGISQPPPDHDLAEDRLVNDLAQAVSTAVAGACGAPSTCVHAGQPAFARPRRLAVLLPPRGDAGADGSTSERTRKAWRGIRQMSLRGGRRNCRGWLFAPRVTSEGLASGPCEALQLSSATAQQACSTTSSAGATNSGRRSSRPTSASSSGPPCSLVPRASLRSSLDSLSTVTAWSFSASPTATSTDSIRTAPRRRRAGPGASGRDRRISGSQPHLVIG